MGQTKRILFNFCVIKFTVIQKKAIWHFTDILYLYRSWIEKTVWKFETEGLRICKILKSLEQFISTVKIFCQFETINVTIGTTNLDVETNI